MKVKVKVKVNDGEVNEAENVDEASRHLWSISEEEQSDLKTFCGPLPTL